MFRICQAPISFKYKKSVAELSFIFRDTTKRQTTMKRTTNDNDKQQLQLIRQKDKQQTTKDNNNNQSSKIDNQLSINYQLSIINC